ncbi:hypothetical protein BSIN_3838 [Burkholderia singularis]|uniref:Uncharacterized protein n=1 Tax=Burkholderia singularis TaxID=1503053 RepID=A0A238H6L2_9BURK|nr:hypothetical protein BSIN_3838 [Burkholderia singularis]
MRLRCELFVVSTFRRVRGEAGWGGRIILRSKARVPPRARLR